jgi:protein-S-isoprenylcysteine O-methyltransferase Ste14
MTVGHLFFAVVMTIYVFIGIYHEEKDLVRMYGKKYEQYRQSTPKILPYSKT